MRETTFPLAGSLVVKRAHILTESERIVEERGDYSIVEKVGHAGERARQLDPRSD